MPNNPPEPGPINPPESGLCFKPVQSAGELAAVAALAQEIWREYYVPLIGAAQVEYMVTNFQSAAAMREQVARGDEYFMITREPTAGTPIGGELLGYLAIRVDAREQSLFISKLYLRRAARGSGSGRGALQFIEEIARARAVQLLWLTVNKRNPAVHAYEKCGFAIAASICMDIGAGFVMDDFRMEKRLAGAAAERMSTHNGAIS
jgi:diamine N-acetyltransferase